MAQILVNMLQYSLDHDHYRAEIYKYIYMLIGMTFLGAASNTLATLTGSFLGEKMIRIIRNETMNKLMRLPVGWY